MAAVPVLLKSGRTVEIDFGPDPTDATIDRMVAEAEKAAAMEADPVPVVAGSSQAEQMSHEPSSTRSSTPRLALAGQSLVEGLTGAADLAARGLAAKGQVDLMNAEYLSGKKQTVTNPLENLPSDATSKPLLDALLGEGQRYQPQNSAENIFLKEIPQALGGEFGVPGLGLASKAITKGDELIQALLGNIGGIAGSEVAGELAPDHQMAGAMLGQAAMGVFPLGNTANNTAQLSQLAFGAGEKPGALGQLGDAIREAAGKPAKPRPPNVTDEQFRDAAELMKFAKSDFGVSLTMDQALGMGPGSAAHMIRDSMSGHLKAGSLRDTLNSQDEDFAREAFRRLDPTAEQGASPNPNSLGDTVVGPGNELRNRADIQDDTFQAANVARRNLVKSETKTALHQQQAELLAAMEQGRTDWVAPARGKPLPANQQVPNLAIDGVNAPAKGAVQVRTMRREFWTDLSTRLAAIPPGKTSEVGALLDGKFQELAAIPIPRDPKKMTSAESMMFLYREYGMRELKRLAADRGFGLSTAMDTEANLATLGLGRNAQEKGRQAGDRFDSTAMGQVRGDKRYNIKNDEAQSRALDTIFRGSNPEMVTQFFDQFAAVGQPRLAEEAYLDWMKKQVDRSMTVRSRPSDLEAFQDSGANVNLARGAPADGFLIEYWKNMFSTEGQRQSMARAMTAIGKNHGMSGEQADQLTHGFTQYMTILALAAPTQGFKDIRLAELRNALGASMFRHLGQVSVITPLRQPALAWVRFVEGNTVQAMSELMTDPDKVEDLIKLANTPVTSTRIMGQLVRRIGATAGVGQDERSSSEEGE